MRSILIVAAAALLSACATAPLTAVQTPVETVDLLLTSATVVDVVKGTTTPDQLVAVRGGDIVAVLPEGEARRYRATRTADLGDRYVMPGLWDMHVHFGGGEALIEENAELMPLYVVNGVVAVRDAAGDLAQQVLDWRDNPPATIDLRLDGRKSFEDACITLADTRRLKALEPETEGAWAPWGAQLAGHFQKTVAVRLFLSTVRSLPAPLNKEKPLIQKERNRAFGTRLRYTARIGRQTRQKAEAVCVQVRKTG